MRQTHRNNYCAITNRYLQNFYGQVFACLFLCFFLLLSFPSYSQYKGNSYDGACNAIVSCPLSGSVSLTNIYTGSSFGGFAKDTLNCSPRAALPDTGRVAYTGGSYSGFAFANVSCQVPGTTLLTNIFKGASNGGFAMGHISCQGLESVLLTDIFTGGAYDGFAFGHVSCPPPINPEETNIYTGSSYAGFASLRISCVAAGQVLLTDVYTGGSYGGFGHDTINCSPRIPPPDTGTVVYTGGSYSGFANANISCQTQPQALLTNIFKGNSYDGYAVAVVSCPVSGSQLLTNIFKGLSYDGFAVVIVADCDFTTGDEDIGKLSSAFIYPNPSNGNFTLSYHLASSKSELLIIDITGRIVYQKSIIGTDGKQEINVSDFNSGIYSWELLSEAIISEKGKIALLKE